jgi:hypothetical protein
MKYILPLAIVSAFLITSSATAQNRGDVISVELLQIRSPEDILQDVVTFADDLPADLVRDLVVTRYQVWGFRVVYHTIDGQGQPTVASGFISAPFGSTERSPVVVYHHGTFTQDARAPSNLGFETILGFAYSSDGYVAVLPDYLGFGANPGFHPYVHAATEASASVDLLRAARSLLASAHFPLNGQVFLTGYSQGGHAVMATLREIERNYAEEFNVVMTVAGSGPYSVSGVQYDFTTGNPLYPSRAYLPYVLTGYQTVYGNLYSDLSEVYVPPYDTLIPELFNRENTIGEIESALPTAWQEIFQPDFMEAITSDPNHPVRIALADNDLLDFTPQSRVLLVYCSEDEQVSPVNATVAWFVYKFVKQSPAPIGRLSLGPFSHGECIPYALIVGKLSFDSLRVR